MKKTIIFLSFLILAGCASFKNTVLLNNLDKNEKICVLTFINNSETPSAGIKVKNIIENELYSRKLNVVFLNSDSDTDSLTEQEINSKIDELTKQGIRYIVFGYVNEWRYKSGIDFEPAVGITVNLYDSNSKKVIWSASGAKTSSSYSSTSITASKLVKKLFKTLK